jgi:hypothetical protein
VPPPLTFHATRLPCVLVKGELLTGPRHHRAGQPGWETPHPVAMLACRGAGAALHPATSSWQAHALALQGFFLNFVGALAYRMC